MNRDRHMEAMDLFMRAVELDESARTRMLDDTCVDPLVRKEVESLLKHHTTRPLIATEKSPKKDRTVPLIQRPLVRDAKLGVQRRKHLLVASTIIVVVLLGTAWWVFFRVEASLKRSVQSKLTTVLDADVRALRMWIDLRQADVRAWAANDEVRQLVSHLSTQPEPLDTKQANAKISKLLRTVCERDGNYGVAVITRQGKIVATSKDAWTAQTVNEKGARYMARLIKGEDVFTVPTRESRFSAGVLSRIMDPTIAVATPVVSDDGQVIGALCFGFDADQEFTDLLAIAQLGEDGETYAFDAHGLLLSNLRHRQRLVDVGLLDETLESALNVELLDPGGNMLRNFVADVPRNEQNATRMIKRAVPTVLDPSPDTGIQCDMDGYRNYLGVTVVGAWQWLGDDLAFGVATELPYDEAFAPLRYVRRAFIFLIASVVMLTAGLVLSSVLVIRLRHQVGEAERLGSYEILELIGKGGMGRVYRARHAFLKRDAAIKLLDGILDKQTIDRFEQEAQLTCQLTNPNTIQVYDYGRTEAGVFYYAMEYLNGCTLEQLVITTGAVPSNRVIFILKQICSSLQEAHDHGLIHRDVKPANVMLCRRGGISDFVKVLDFGIAKKTTGECDLTRDDTIVGTPQYIAPERIAGGGRVDARSDIFSVGCVAFYLLTGETPFHGETPAQLFHEILNLDAPAPSSRLDAPIVPELDRLVIRCLERDPSDRPQSAQEIVSLLDELGEQDSWHRKDADDWWKQWQQQQKSSTDMETGKLAETSESESSTRALS